MRVLAAIALVAQLFLVPSGSASAAKQHGDRESAAAVVRSYKIKLARFGLTPSEAQRSSRAGLTAASNPLVPLWAGLVRVGLPKIDSIQRSDTVDGNPSIFILLHSAPAPDPQKPGPIQQLFGLTYALTSGDIQALPPKDCGGTQSEKNACCLDGPYPECVASYSWDDCNNDICRDFEKLNGYFTVLKAISRELSVHSKLVPKSQLLVNIPGDRLLFLWPYANTKGREPVYLRTELSADVIDRVLVYSHFAQPLVGKLKGIQPSSEKALCDGFGSRYSDFQLGDASRPEIFFAGLGRDTAATGLPGHSSSYSHSVYIESQANESRLALTAGAKPAVGAGNPEFIQFSTIGQTEPTRQLFCLPSVTMKQIYDYRSLLNSSESSVFVFGLTYLREFWKLLEG